MKTKIILALNLRVNSPTTENFYDFEKTYYIDEAIYLSSTNRIIYDECILFNKSFSRFKVLSRAYFVKEGVFKIFAMKHETIGIDEKEEMFNKLQDDSWEFVREYANGKWSV